METRKWIATLAFTVGLLTFGLVSLGIAAISGNSFSHLVWYSLMGMFAWLFIYVGWGLTIVGTNEYVMIERFRTAYRILDSGLHVLCLPPFVDSKKQKGDYKWKRITLFRDEPDNKIDFIDGVSAAVDGEVWYRIRKASEAETIPLETNPVYLWTYIVDQPEGRIEEVVDNELRPILEQHSSEEAGSKLKEIVKTVQTKKDSETGEDQTTIDDILKEFGAELHPQKGILLTDVKLPQEVIELRQIAKEAEKKALAQASLGGGYVNAILGIQQRANENKTPKSRDWVTFEHAERIYVTQQGLVTIGSTKANVTFVSPDIKGMQTMIGVNTSTKAETEPREKKEK